MLTDLQRWYCQSQARRVSPARAASLITVSDMAMTIALITGANKGIGFETAHQLGARGVTVLVGARDEARGLQAERALRDAGADARFVRLDTTDPKSA